MAYCVSSPSLQDRATSPFRISEVKQNNAVFLQHMALLLQQINGSTLDDPKAWVDACALRPSSLENELEAVQPGIHFTAQPSGRHQADAASLAQPVQASPAIPATATIAPSPGSPRDGPQAGGAQAGGDAAPSAKLRLLEVEGESSVRDACHGMTAAERLGISAPGSAGNSSRGITVRAADGEAKEAGSEPAAEMPGDASVIEQRVHAEGAAAQRKARRQRKRPAYLSAYTEVAAPGQPSTQPAGDRSLQLVVKDEQLPDLPPLHAAQPSARAHRAPLVSAAVKVERVAQLEAYQEIVEGVKRRRRERLEAAGKALRSVHCMLERQKGAAPGVLLAQQQEQLAREAQERVESAWQAGQEAPAEYRVPPGEVVLHVCVHLPQHLSGVGAGGAASQPPPSQELLVLGSQPLTTLRDGIQCLTDKNVRAVEQQENRKRERDGLPPTQLSTPSAYLYVEGTFYNDMRHPNAADCSAPIRAFNREHGVAAPPHPPPSSVRSDIHTTQFSTARMEGTTFDQLWLRLGSGGVNVYSHQGGCEHAVVFKDARLFDPGCDPPLLSQYPFQLHPEMAGHKRQCEACQASQADKVTYDDRHTPHTPFYWCDDCFKLMHYDEEGVARYEDFQVFPYNYEYRDSRTGAQRIAPARGVAAMALGPV